METSEERLYRKIERNVLSPKKTHTPFQKQSICERLDVVRNAGHVVDKKIESRAFWKADR